jgi:hypothetical protein
MGIATFRRNILPQSSWRWRRRWGEDGDGNGIKMEMGER